MAIAARKKLLADGERLLDPGSRYWDLAVRFRVLEPDGTVGRLLPQTVGGRWDTWTTSWVSPRPPDVECVEWTIQEQQIAPLLQLRHDDLLVAIFAGRQAGKSDCALKGVVLDAARYPGRDTFVISRDFKASREPEQMVRSLLPPRWGVQWTATDRVLTFPHGHRILFRSAEAIDSCRGPSTKTILLEEAALMTEEQYLAAIGSGMASKDFRLWVPTTPRREVGWIRRVYQEWEHQPHSRVFHLRTADNPRCNRELLERLKADTPAHLYEQEFEGKLVPPQNAVYPRFKRSTHLRPPPETGDVTRQFTATKFRASADYLIGWDFGKEAAVVCKVFRGASSDGRPTEFLWVVGVEYNPNTTTEHHSRAVADRWGTSAVVITDAMGAYDRSEGRGWDSAGIEILEERRFRRVLPVAKHNPDVRDRVRLVDRLLENCNGETRLFVSPRGCDPLIDALENQEMHDGKPKKDGVYEHVADALGYLCFACFPVASELPAGFRPALQGEV